MACAGNAEAGGQRLGGGEDHETDAEPDPEEKEGLSDPHRRGGHEPPAGRGGRPQPASDWWF